MSYRKLSELINLATDLQATSIGLTYDELINKFKLRGYNYSKKNNEKNVRWFN